MAELHTVHFGFATSISDRLTAPDLMTRVPDRAGCRDTMLKESCQNRENAEFHLLVKLIQTLSRGKA